MQRTMKTKARKGQALVEYALLVVCIAVVCAVAASVLGHKTADSLAVAAAIMPGAHSDDNAPIATAGLMPTNVVGGVIVLDSTLLVAAAGVDRYAPVFGAGGSAGLVGGD